MGPINEISQSVVEVIDNNLGKRPPWKWSLGQWYLAVLALGFASAAALGIWAAFIVPTVWLFQQINSGAALKFLQNISASTVGSTLMAAAGTFFIIISGVMLTKQALIGLSVLIRSPHFSIVAELEKARQAEISPLRRLLYWPALLLGAIVVISVFGLATAMMWYQIFTGCSLFH